MLLEISNPATGELLKEISVDDRISMTDKYRAAKEAQRDWAKTSFVKRRQVLVRFNTLLAERNELLAQLLTQEMGKPIAQARGEITAVSDRINFFLEHTESIIGDKIVAGEYRKEGESAEKEIVRYEPLGVIINISAWNYPYFVGANVFIPALLGGNAVLYKPSEIVTGTGQEIARCLYDAGLPKALFSVIIGDGRVGAQLLEQPIDGVFFTGSYATGKRIKVALAERMIPVQLELGGKDPLYVRHDVDVQHVAEAVAEGTFYNAGQSCCAVERVYVHADVYDTFIKHLVDCAKSLVVGDPTNDNTDMGPLAMPRQEGVLAAQIKDAVASGARILCGGQSFERGGVYFQPTVIVDVTHKMTLMREETFGPVIGVAKVSDDDEAIRLMNDSVFGLTASVYTENRAVAEGIMQQLNAGTVYLNCCDRISPRMPWSGRSHSGIGSTLGSEGIRCFVKPKSWYLS